MSSRRRTSRFGYLINLVALIISLVDFISTLQVIHNRADVYHSGGLIKSKSGSKSPIKLERSTPTILKSYSENITATSGHLAVLKCPYLINGSLHDMPYQDDSSFIKTVIWTRELNSSVLLSNNQEVLTRSYRFRLEQSDDGIIINEPNRYDLHICPVKIKDSGWYSCYVVRKHKHHPNIKHYVYLSVIGGDGSFEDLDNQQEYDYDYNYVRGGDRCKSVVDTTTTLSPSTTTTIPISTSRIIKTTSEITTDIIVTKKVNRDKTDRVIDTTTSINTLKSTTTHREAITIRTISKKLTFQPNRTHTIETIDNSRGSIKSSGKVVVSPKLANHTQFKSFQLDCVYHGSDYLSVNLIWIKNNKQLNGKEVNSKHYYVLEFKQDQSRISLLKFRYALMSDAGVYKCVAVDGLLKLKKNSPHDSVHLIIQPNDLGSQLNYFQSNPYFQFDDDDTDLDQANSASSITPCLCSLLILIIVIKE